MTAIDNFANNIRHLMSKAGMTQGELSKKSGVDQAGISLYLARKKEPSIATCEKICSVFGISLSEAFSGITPKARIETIELPDQIQHAIEEGIKRGLSQKGPLVDVSAEPRLERVIKKLSKLEPVRLKNLEELIDRQLARQKKGSQEGTG